MIVTTALKNSAMILSPRQYKDFLLCCDLLFVRSYRKVMDGEPVSSHYRERVRVTAVFELGCNCPLNVTEAVDTVLPDISV